MSHEDYYERVTRIVDEHMSRIAKKYAELCESADIPDTEPDTGPDTDYHDLDEMDIDEEGAKVIETVNSKGKPAYKVIYNGKEHSVVYPDKNLAIRVANAITVGDLETISFVDGKLSEMRSLIKLYMTTKNEYAKKEFIRLKKELGI